MISHEVAKHNCCVGIRKSARKDNFEPRQKAGELLDWRSFPKAT